MTAAHKIRVQPPRAMGKVLDRIDDGAGKMIRSAQIVDAWTHDVRGPDHERARHRASGSSQRAEVAGGLVFFADPSGNAVGAMRYDPAAE